jgi:hypothetical protein
MYIALLIVVGIVSLYLGIKAGFTVGFSYGLDQSEVKLATLLTIIKNGDETKYDQILDDLNKAQVEFKKAVKQ